MLLNLQRISKEPCDLKISSNSSRSCLLLIHFSATHPDTRYAFIFRHQAPFRLNSGLKASGLWLPSGLRPKSREHTQNFVPGQIALFNLPTERAFLSSTMFTSLANSCASSPVPSLLLLLETLVLPPLGDKGEGDPQSRLDTDFISVDSISVSPNWAISMIARYTKMYCFWKKRRQK